MVVVVVVADEGAGVRLTPAGSGCKDPGVPEEEEMREEEEEDDPLDGVPWGS